MRRPTRADGQSVPKATNGVFEITVLNCVYERVSYNELELVSKADVQKFNRSHDDASEEDLKALRYTDKPKKEIEYQDDEPVEDKLANLTVENVENVEIEDPFKDVPVLSRTKAELYLFDTETDVFVIQEKEVDVDMASNGDYDSELRSSICPTKLGMF